MEKITAVFLAAGISSRFKGKMKALARVGPKNESLLEVSMNQAMDAGFSEFVIIASDKTIEPLKKEFKNSFKGVPIAYCLQKTPAYRKKPFGTGHALLAAKDSVNGPFAVLNGDDIYGAKTMKLIFDCLNGGKEAYCLAGYRLKNCVPKQGAVNRGIITADENFILKNIVETFNISSADIPAKFSGEELVSMNLFGLQPEFFTYLEKEFSAFERNSKDSPEKEFLLPEIISDFMKKNNLDMIVIPTEDAPIGITNPGDEEIVREKLNAM